MISTRRFALAFCLLVTVGSTLINVSSAFAQNPPTVPTGLTATPISSTQIKLSWGASTDTLGIKGYNLYRNGVFLIATNNANTTLTNISLIPGTTYTYAVSAYDPAGYTSAQSGAVSATTFTTTGAPTVPGGLTASPISSSQIKLSWSASSDSLGIKGYNLYRNGVFLIATNNANTTFTNSSLNAGTTYTYTVSAYDMAGNTSGQSNSAVATTPTTTVGPSTPTTPTGLQVTNITASTISLSWSPSSAALGIKGYNLYRNGIFLIATNNTNTTFTNISLIAGGTYTYTVSAYDTAGNISGQSSSVSATIPAATTNSSGYGLATGETLVGMDSTALNNELNSIAAMGVGWVRVDFQWDNIQPNNPNSFNWNQYDALVAATNAHHINILAILDYTAPWDISPSCSPRSDRCPPTNLTDYSNYVKAVVQRYGPQGINSWEIWNEENMGSNWIPAPDPVAYTRLLQTAYAAIKSVDSNATVITGGLAPAADTGSNISPISFVTAMYANGAHGNFDAIGYHPYSYPVLPTDYQPWNAWSIMGSTPVSIRSLMVANGDSGKKIWLTEFGAPTQGPGNVATDNTTWKTVGNIDHVTEAFQSQIFVSAINTVKSISYAGPLFLYSYQDIGTDTSNRENFFGILRYDGSTKPAYSGIMNALL